MRAINLEVFLRRRPAFIAAPSLKTTRAFGARKDKLARSEIVSSTCSYREFAWIKNVVLPLEGEEFWYGI